MYFKLKRVMLLLFAASFYNVRSSMFFSLNRFMGQYELLQKLIFKRKVLHETGVKGTT